MVNAEAYLIQKLNQQSELAGTARAYADVPAERPNRFITVERVGGKPRAHQTGVVFAVQCWGENRLDAARLADEVTAAIKLFNLLPEVALLEVESVYNFPDSVSGQARYQLTVSGILHLQH